MNFNNNMKQVLHILLTLLLLFTFSCNDDNVNNDNNSILIGSWGEQFPADEFFELTFYNDDTTVKKANEIKDRVLKCVYNIKQERSYNNDLVGIFERYKDIADGDMEVAMNFIKEAYLFNEETESFIRKKFDMPIPDESKEQ